MAFVAQSAASVKSDGRNRGGLQLSTINIPAGGRPTKGLRSLNGLYIACLWHRRELDSFEYGFDCLAASFSKLLPLPSQQGENVRSHEISGKHLYSAKKTKGFC